MPDLSQLSNAELLYGMAAPGLIAIIGAVIEWVRLRRPSNHEESSPVSDRGSIVIATTMMLAAGVAFFGITGWPDEAWRKLSFIAAAAGILGVVASACRCCNGVKWIVMAAASIAAGDMIRIWLFQAGDLFFMQFVVPWGSLLLLLLLEPLAGRVRGPLIPLALWIAIGTAAFIVGDSGSSSRAVALGAVSIPAFVFLVVAFLRRDLSFAGGALVVPCIMLPASMVVAWLYDGRIDSPAPAFIPEWGWLVAVSPLLPFLLPIAAPLAAWCGPLLVRNKEMVRRRALVSGLAVLTICAVALAFYFGSKERPGEGGGSPSDYAMLVQAP